MRIRPVSETCVVIETLAGTFPVEIGDGWVRICMCDHFTLMVMGKHKQVPLVVVDSDEHPTRLEVRETESRWLSVDLEVSDAK